MSIMRYLTAAAAIGGIAAPLAAQSSYPYPQQYPQTYPQQYPQTGYGYPGQTYPGYAQPGYSNGGPVQQIIDSLLGNRYNVTDRQAVSQCASAVMAQAATQYGGGYGAYNQGYNQSYGQNLRGGSMRVTAITDVQRRSNGLRVTGLIDSRGGYGHHGYGSGSYTNGYNGGGYDSNYRGRGDLSFRCNVDYRGAVTGIRIRPTADWRR